VKSVESLLRARELESSLKDKGALITAFKNPHRKQAWSLKTRQVLHLIFREISHFCNQITEKLDSLSPQLFKRRQGTYQEDTLVTTQAVLNGTLAHEEVKSKPYVSY